MGDKTGISWTDATWNPIRGCSIVSPGCTNCYAMKQARRMDHPGGAYEGLTEMTSGGVVWNGKVRTVPHLLEQPLRWRKPRRIFVNSMSDLFHEDVSVDFIARVWEVMAATPWHDYQILTKRPGRMRDVVEDIGIDAVEHGQYRHGVTFDADDFQPADGLEWPLPNVWLGVSVEDHKRADERILLLLETPAAVRFISAEPLLGPLEFPLEWLAPFKDTDPMLNRTPRIDWVIVGGESGKPWRKIRHCNVQWIRDIVSQCREAEVPVFVKQLGTRIRYDEQNMFNDWMCANVQHPKGGDPAEWPDDLRLQQFPKEKTA